MPPSIMMPRTTGSNDFHPDALFTKWSESPTLPIANDLRSSIIQTFSLAERDDFVYHAIASVTLADVQDAIDRGGAGGLHAWYRDEEGKSVSLPS